MRTLSRRCELCMPGVPPPEARPVGEGPAPNPGCRHPRRHPAGTPAGTAPAPRRHRAGTPPAPAGTPAGTWARTGPAPSRLEVGREPAWVLRWESTPSGRESTGSRLPRHRESTGS